MIRRVIDLPLTSYNLNRATISGTPIVSSVRCSRLSGTYRLTPGIDIFSWLAAEESAEGRNIITVVTKYPPGTLARRGGARWRGKGERLFRGRKRQRRTFERKGEGKRASNGRNGGGTGAWGLPGGRWLPAVLIIVPALSRWCSGSPRAQRLNAPAVGIQFTLTMFPGVPESAVEMSHFTPSPWCLLNLGPFSSRK